MEIKKGAKSFYIGDSEESALAQMSFVLTGENIIIIDSTFVADELKGQRIGSFLLDELVKWARRENKKILPLCPYAKAQIEKNSNYKDVLYV